MAAGVFCFGREAGLSCLVFSDNCVVAIARNGCAVKGMLVFKYNAQT